MAILDQPAQSPEILNTTDAAAVIQPGISYEFQTPQEAYTVDAELMDSLEASLVTELRDNVDLDGPEVVAVVVPPESPYANFGRMSETIAYDGYNNHAAMMPYEGRSIWLYTVDLSEGASGISHVKRLVPALPAAEREATGLTGIEVIDDRLKATDPEEVADLGSIMSFHNITDLSTVWNVTSNHSTGRVHPDVKGLESGMDTLRSYKATYQLGKEAGIKHLFAYLNGKAIKSLGRTGVEPVIMLDREFHLPEPDGSGYDLHYTAVDIPYTPENEARFTTAITFEPTGDETLDRRLSWRAEISKFLANVAVPVYAVGPPSREDIPYIVRTL